MIEQHLTPDEQERARSTHGDPRIERALDAREGFAEYLARARR
jgi:hypothetical protein